MRMLAVLAIILFLARPMTGGWSGFFSSGEPEIILLALDRSASMETRLPDGQTRREKALKSFAETAAAREGSTVVLVENVFRDPQALSSPADLLNPEMERYIGPTDTASDIPALLATSLDWLENNDVGSAEIWIASDLRTNDWLPSGSEPRWKRLSERLKEVNEKYALRLLNYDAESTENAGLRCEKVVRRKNILRCAMTLDISKIKETSLFLEVLLNGQRSEEECLFEGSRFLWQPELKLTSETKQGWGKFSLPKDGNPGDDEAYFVYGSPQNAKGFVITENPEIRRSLAKASINIAASEDKDPVTKEIVDLKAGELDAASLLFWQGPLPTNETAETISDFVKKGGRVLFLPPETDDGGTFASCSWGGSETRKKDEGTFKITTWEENDGPLANTEEGLRLPLSEVQVSKRRKLDGEARTLAFFEDGAPLLSRIALGKGEVYFLCTLPQAEWSDLADGFILVPMAQRLLESGAGRFNPPASLPCGTPGLAPPGTEWQCIDTPGQKDFNAKAGIYQINGQLVALNRPVLEDDKATLTLKQCKGLLSEELSTLQGTSDQSSEIPAEIWRSFLFLTLGALVVEALLVLPKKEKSNAPMGRKQEGRA